MKNKLEERWKEPHLKAPKQHGRATEQLYTRLCLKWPYKKFMQLWGPCEAPKCMLIVNCLQQSGDDRLCPIEDTVITVFPNFRYNEDDKGVETMPKFFTKLISSTAPPTREASNRDLGSNRDKTQLMQHYCPCWEKTQEHKICWIVSSAWSHNGHTWGCERSLVASKSAVLERSLMASHKKNLQRSGSQDIQILFQRANLIVPRKKSIVNRFTRRLIL